MSSRASRTTKGKSPSRPAPPERTRSSSRTRRPPRVELATTPVKQSPRRSPSRKSPARKPAKDAVSPNKIISRLQDKLIEIRDSVSPEGKVEEVVRRSVSHFEEITSDVITSVRRSNRFGPREEQIRSSVAKEKPSTGTATRKENNVDSTTEDKQYGPTVCSLLVPLLMAVLLPAGVVSAHIACSKESVPLVKERFVDLEAIGWYVGFFLAQFILSAIPLGPKFSSSTRSDSFNYRANGLSVLVLTSAFFVGLVQYYDFHPTTLLDRTLPFLIASIVTALVVSLALYCKAALRIGTRADSVSTGSAVRDFLLGAEVSPRIGPIDILTTILRTGLLIVMIYNGLLVYKEIAGKSLEDISIGVILVPVMQSLFAADSIVFQSDFVSSLTAQYSGTGLEVTIHTAVFPFWITLLSKYLLISRAACSPWVAAAAAVAFTVGLVIHRLSSRLKANFRRNPSSYPSSALVLSRHSPLYKGSVWGWVRHPNYLGVLIMYTSWTAFALLSAPPHWIPAVILAYTFIELLVHMSARVEPHCLSKHGSAWNIYTSYVKCKLFPGLY